MTSLPQSRLVVSQRSAAGWENCRSLGFARDDEKEAGRVLWYPTQAKTVLEWGTQRSAAGWELPAGVC
jgi:hypothetical protein